MNPTCPICGTTSVSFVTNSLRRGKGNIYSCIFCEHEFLVPDNERDLKEFYENNYWKKVGPSLENKTEYKAIFDSYVNYQKNRLNLLKKFIKPESKLIEIGCSTGHFLYNVSSFVKEVVGVDFDQDALDYCHDKNNCRVFSGGINEAAIQLKNEQFDIVCCFQVLEHIEDLEEFLWSLKKLCKTGGLIYIEVPNLYDPLKSLYEVNNYIPFYYHEDHIHYFSKKSLGKLLRKINMEADFFFYQDYNLLNHLTWILTGKPQPICHDGLGEISLPFIESAKKEDQNLILNTINEFNNKYLKILAEIGLTDNMAVLIENKP